MIVLIFERLGRVYEPMFRLSWVLCWDDCCRGMLGSHSWGWRRAPPSSTFREHLMREGR